MRPLLLAAVILAGCATSSDPRYDRAFDAVDKFGRSGLTAAERGDAAAYLVEACHRSENSPGYRLGVLDADPDVLEAIRYVCPEVIGP